MVSCPECAGYMKFDRYVRLYVCQRCGLALKRKEIEEQHDKRREMIAEEQDKDEARSQRHKDYLDWYLSKKE